MHICGIWVPNFVWNFKVTFEISHKIWNPYTAKCAFYEVLIAWQIMYDILELWHLKSYWEGPWLFPCPLTTTKLYEMYPLIGNDLEKKNPAYFSALSHRHCHDGVLI